jgi:peptide-methionine (S)-S-oxide reductase
VELRFDPQEVSYGELLQIYFSVAHDPTQRDRQGPDTGKQYRSSLFYADDSQKRIAEAYHQDFLIKNPRHPDIVINDLPKLDSLKRVFPARYREEPVTALGSR